MKKVKSLVFLGFILVGCIGSSFAVDTFTEKPIIKIGVTATMSGDRAFYGQDFVQAVQMAIDDRAAQTKNHYEIIVEDNQFDMKATALLTQKFIAVDHVNAILDLWDQPGFVIAPLAERAKIPHICVGWSPEVANGKYSFMCYTSPVLMADKLAAEILKRGFKKIAIIETNYNAYIDLSRELNTELAKGGASIVSTQKFVDGSRDFRTIIAKAQDSQPDLYCIFSISPEMDLLMRQLKETNTKIPVASIETAGESPERKLFDGVWFVAAPLPNKEFSDRFFAKYHKDKIINFSGFGYIATNLLIDAFESLPPTTTKLEDLREGAFDYLKSITSFSSICGEMKPTGTRYFSADPVMKIIHGDQIELLP